MTQRPSYVATLVCFIHDKNYLAHLLQDIKFNLKLPFCSDIAPQTAPGEKEDSFPTFYRANSEGSLKTLAQNAGFAVEIVQLIEGRPEYLRFNALSYLLGLSYERVVNSTELLRHFRVLLVGVLRKTI